MLIVTQNKKAIINADKALAIYADKNNFIIAEFGIKKNIIGKYSTTEKAAKVLKEIVKKYHNHKLSMYAGYDNDIYENDVFYIPADNEV